MTGDIKRGQTEVRVESGVSVDDVVEIVKPCSFVPFNPIGRGLSVTDEQIYEMQVDCKYVPNSDIAIDEMFEEDHSEKPIAQEVSIQDYKQAHKMLESERAALDSKFASFSTKRLNSGYKVEECSEEKAKEILKCAIY